MDGSDCWYTPKYRICHEEATQSSSDHKAWNHCSSSSSSQGGLELGITERDFLLFQMLMQEASEFPWQTERSLLHINIH